MFTCTSTDEAFSNKLLYGFSGIADKLFLESQDFSKDPSLSSNPFVNRFGNFFEVTVDYAPDVDVLSARLASSTKTFDIIATFLVDAYFGVFLSLGTPNVRIIFSEMTHQQRLQLLICVLISFFLHFYNTYFAIMNLSDIISPSTFQ